MLDRTDVKYFKLAVGAQNIKKETDVDIAARCPVCSADDRWKNTSRLHLYVKGTVTNVNCFSGDCPITNKSVYSFLREFYPQFLPNYKRDNFGNTIDKLKSMKDEPSDVFASFKKEEPKKEKPVITQDLSAFMTPIEDVPEALAYINGRKIEYTGKFGKWYYGHQNLKIGEVTYPITGAVIIPLYYEEEMYGFYSRSIHDKSFYTYMSEHNIGYKIWNWFNVDKDKPVYIFEAIFDAISSGYDNIIACMGAKLPDERLAELKQPIFVLDDDVTGKKNSIEYANLNHKVFVSPEGLAKDMNENLKNGINTRELIANNLFTGISAITRIKAKL